MDSDEREDMLGEKREGIYTTAECENAGKEMNGGEVNNDGVGAVNDSVFSSNDLSAASVRASMLMLPPELITKILYRTFLSYGSSQTLSFLYTSKYFYYGFLYMIYSLNPLYLSSKRSMGGMDLDQLKNKTVLDSIPKVKLLNITLHPIRILCLSTNLNLEQQLHCILPKFTSLKSLHMKSHTVCSIKILNFAPATLEHFSMTITAKPSFITYKSGFQDLGAKFVERNIHLKSFHVSSNEPLISRKISSLLCLGFMERYEVRDRAQFDLFSEQYFRHSIVRYYELLKRNRKSLLERFGDFVFDILKSSDRSLQMVELKNIDLHLIFSISKDCRFSELQLLIFDKTSELQLFKWLPHLRSCNRHSSMLLFMNDHWAQQVFATNLDGPIGIPATWKCYKESSKIIAFTKHKMKLV